MRVGIATAGQPVQALPDEAIAFAAGGLEPGAIEFIPKPFSQQELAERIRALLDERYSPATNS